MDTLKLLCQCISPTENTEKIVSIMHYSKVDWDAIVYSSGEHLVTPALWFYLNKKGILPSLNKELQDYLMLVYDLNLSRNYKIINQLSSLLPDFNATGIEPLLLKGIAGLLTDLYESPGIRVLSDIDILIPIDKLSIAGDIMQQHGYTFTPFRHQDIAREHRHLPAFVHKNQPVSIEIHKYPVALKYYNWVNQQSAWNKSLAIQLKTGTMRLPSPEFRLLHNFCHCQLGDQGYFKGYVNARQLMEWVELREHHEAEFDWDSIQKRVKFNHSTAAWGGYVLAAEYFFSQRPMPNTSMPALAHLFIHRQQWRRYSPSYRKINNKLIHLFSFVEEAVSTLVLNFQRGPKSFFNTVWFSCKLLASLEWHKKKWNTFKNLQ